MEKDLPDIQQLDPEENDHQFGADERPGTRRYRARREDPFWKGTPQPRPLLQQSLRSSSSFALISLGVNILLLVATCVVGSQRTQLQEELWALKGRISNFSSTLTQLRAVSFHGGSTGNKVTSLETKLEKQVQDLKADHNSLLLHLKHFPADLRTLTCQVAFFRSNGTECCPVNWLEFEGSCYWFSRSGKTWAEAEKYCQLEDSHLVVINSREEQKFILQHTNPYHAWIGLNESSGSWRWVDGTDYNSNYRNWAPTQPDNWRGHEVGGNEDCAEIRTDGGWNDDFCLQMRRWVCEMKSNITS
ncbi:asialoglycoprotein receptor 2 isoform X2 [Erinaceus europaeus]|uniref:Asialoglycoprotein receptor 2 isoform X2 n=1 Tax=Erinaceus europaeus TaxID=9365 RepID=A0A1S2ZRB9_ERIEU|nr:asialoglycoprotein receptor 2 isoform X2 [Erinaceus europaeus]